jgi:uncharacterized protein (TIGR02246 family)
MPSRHDTAVRGVLDAVYAAWAENDPDAFAKLYAEDATAVLPGSYLANRDAIQATMAEVFAGSLKGSRAAYEVQSLRFVGSAAAVVISKGAVVPAGQSEPAPESRSLETWVIAHDEGRWRVESFHNCPESPILPAARSDRPSRESDAVREMYLRWTEARIRGEQQDNESWGDLTMEPRGVDYMEIEAAGLPAMWASPKGLVEDRVLLCMHGGGFVGGSIYTHRKLFGHLANAVGARALSFDYRLAPGHAHPAQLQDAIAVYRWLLDQGLDPGGIAFAGDSSGGGLAITTQLLAREQDLPLPAAAMLISPWVDMEVIGDSYRANWGSDPFFYREVVSGLAAMFLGEDGDPRDPLANPLHADLAGLSPMYVQVGGNETLLDDSRRLAEHARAAGVEARLEVFAGQLHTFQMAAGRAPEADDAIRRFAEWVRPKLGLPDPARLTPMGR